MKVIYIPPSPIVPFSPTYEAFASPPPRSPTPARELRARRATQSPENRRLSARSQWARPSNAKPRWSTRSSDASPRHQVHSSAHSEPSDSSTRKPSVFSRCGSKKSPWESSQSDQNPTTASDLENGSRLRRRQYPRGGLPNSRFFFSGTIRGTHRTA